MMYASCLVLPKCDRKHPCSSFNPPPPSTTTTIPHCTTSLPPLNLPLFWPTPCWFLGPWADRNYWLNLCCSDSSTYRAWLTLSTLPLLPLNKYTAYFKVLQAKQSCLSLNLSIWIIDRRVLLHVCFANQKSSWMTLKLADVAKTLKTTQAFFLYRIYSFRL